MKTKTKSTKKEYKTSISEISLKFTKSDFKKTKITCSQDAEEAIRKFYGDDIHMFESFFILLVNKANITTGFAKISQGGVAGTVCDMKIVAKYAIDALAPSVIIAHNHPSGNRRPSSTDINMTDRVKKGLKLLDVTLLDHIILTPENGYYSFADDGRL